MLLIAPYEWKHLSNFEAEICPYLADTKPGCTWCTLFHMTSGEPLLDTPSSPRVPENQLISDEKHM